MPRGLPQVRGDLMDIPAYLALQSTMKSLKVIDDSLVEIVQILLEKIETLEMKVQILEGQKDES